MYLREKPPKVELPPCGGCDICGDCQPAEPDGQAKLYALCYDGKYRCYDCFDKWATNWPRKREMPQTTERGCPTCGRANQDWKDRSTKILNEQGTKTRVQEAEDRLSDYRDWRRTFGKQYVAVDVDQVEWRNGKPVAILEMTRIDGAPNPPKTYFDGVLDRKIRDNENKRQEYLAQALGIKAYIVCYTQDLTEFHVYRVYPELKEWKTFTKDMYEGWIRSLA